MKLHLGCGRYYLEGYINVDYPPTEHTVQSDIKPDIYCDITKLSYRPESIEEIRLHHVFEHFSRPVALALLCRWRDWLKVGGILRIETPDLSASLLLLISPFSSYKKKQQVIRHLFGSHESHWAVHWDGWYADRFRRTLLMLGFEGPIFEFTRWGALRNVDVTTRKSARAIDYAEYENLVSELLQHSLIGTPASPPMKAGGSEKELLDVWMHAWKVAYLAK